MSDAFQKKSFMYDALKERSNRLGLIMTEYKAGWIIIDPDDPYNGTHCTTLHRIKVFLDEYERRNNAR